MNQPLVSIITPSYNQGRFIRDTIESVLNQNYSNIEYIVVDGGSTDETLAILDEYKDRITIVCEKDEGQSDAINKGFKMAKGSIVAWLNSDDVYEPGAIQAAVDLLESHQNAAMIYGEGYIIDENGKKIKRFENTIDYNLWMLIYVWDYIMQPTTFFRKSALQEVGYLDKSLNWVMDWDLWIKFGLKYDIVYTNKFLACSREYGETKTSQGEWKRIKEIGRLFRRYTGILKTPGYKIFYYVERAKHSHFKYLQNNYQNKAVNILKNVPILDQNGYCGKITKFIFRSNMQSKKINIYNESDIEQQINIFLNDKKYQTIIVGMREDLCVNIELDQHLKYNLVTMELNEIDDVDNKVKIYLNN